LEDEVPAQRPKSCHCGLWTTNPSALRAQGLPEGYCGFCSALVDGKPCGKPGHLISGPGPYSFGYCDEHPHGRFLHFGCVAFAALLLVAGSIILIWWLL
jgi:hypothetical protein